MREKDLKRQSETNWDKIEAMTDEEIDVSDIPPLGDSFFDQAKLRMPKDKVSVLINVDRETDDWFESQGVEAKDLMSAALRIYAQVHKKIHR